MSKAVSKTTATALVAAGKKLPDAPRPPTTPTATRTSDLLKTGTLPAVPPANGRGVPIAANHAPLPAKRGFDYSILPDSRRRDLESHARVVHEAGRRIAAGVLEIGARLEDAARILDCHQYRDWLEAEFGWDESMATHFRQSFRAFSAIDCVSRFDVSAMYALAAENVPREAFDEALERARHGERISKKIAVEIVQRQKRALGLILHRQPRKDEDETLAEAIEVKLEQALDLDEAGRERMAERIVRWAETWPELLRKRTTGAAAVAGGGGGKSDRES